MKIAIRMVIALLMLAPLQSFAATKKLKCAGNSRWEGFAATLDDSRFQKGSGLAEVVGANIRDGYLSADLKCTGYRPHEITCVGFWFDMGTEIMSVAVRDVNGELVAQHRTLEGHMSNKDGSQWKCSIE